MTSSALQALVDRVAQGRMTRAEFVTRAVALGLSASAAATILAACGGATTTSTSMSPTPLDSTKPDHIILFNWSDYMDPGVLKDFQRRYGVSVKEAYFEDNDTMLAKVKAGATGYDVIVPTGWMVSIMAKTGLLRPLEMSLIPNFSGVMSAFQSPSYDPGTGGRRYSVPYMFGRTGIDVRTDKVSETITSWRSLWDEKYKNQIIMLADARGALEAALYLIGSDCNCTDMDTLKQAKQKLIEQKPLVRKYDAVPLRNIEAGNPLTEGWDGDVARAQGELGADKVAFVAPSEGFSVWTDTFVVPNTAGSPYWAHMFVNYLLDPQVAAKLSLFTGYQTPVADAASYITDPILKAMRPSDEVMQSAHTYEDLGEFNNVYNQLWAEVKSA
jgi:spermidine/putrescine transport system substrate-binding protein